MNSTIKIIFITLFSLIGFNSYSQTKTFPYLDNIYLNKSIVRIDTIEMYNFLNPPIDIVTILSDTVISNPDIDTLLLNGLDCSMWQSNIKWDRIDSTYTFVFIKATQSLRVDSKFYDNWNKADMIKGAYHFFNPNVNGITQAKFFLSVVKFEKGNLPPVIDVEYYSYYWRHCNRYTAAKNLRLFLEYVESQIGTTPIIYTNSGFWNKYVYDYIKFNPSKYYLWIAHYETETPRIPKGWNDWTFWQYTHKGRLREHYTFWDLNYFNGYDLSEILIK